MFNMGGGKFKLFGANCLRGILDNHGVLHIIQKVKKQNQKSLHKSVKYPKRLTRVKCLKNIACCCTKSKQQFLLYL